MSMVIRIDASRVSEQLRVISSVMRRLIDILNRFEFVRAFPVLSLSLRRCCQSALFVTLSRLTHRILRPVHIA